MAVWGMFEKPVAVCRRCFESIPFGAVKQIYLLKLQVIELNRKVDQLFQAQQELEEVLTRQ